LREAGFDVGDGGEEETNIELIMNNPHNNLELNVVLFHHKVYKLTHLAN